MTSGRNGRFGEGFGPQDRETSVPVENKLDPKGDYQSC